MHPHHGDVEQTQLCPHRQLELHRLLAGLQVGEQGLQSILTKWHPDDKCVVFTTLHTLFQRGRCKILQHSTATGVLSPASIWTGGIIHSFIIFMLKNSCQKTALEIYANLTF